MKHTLKHRRTLWITNEYIYMFIFSTGHILLYKIHLNYLFQYTYEVIQMKLPWLLLL